MPRRQYAKRGRGAARCLTLLLLALVLPGVTAEAKQCVWNKSGFTLTIRWYTPDQALVRGTYLWVQQDATPYQTDTQRSGSGACSERAGRNIAVLSTVDWWMFKQTEGDTAYSPQNACGKLTGGKDCVLSNASTDRSDAVYQFLKTYCNAYDPFLVDWYTFCTAKGTDI